MKKYKYFAVSENASDYYYTLKDAFDDLHTFGDDEVRLYSLKKCDDIQELTSEDLIGIYHNGKLVSYY